jgi:hypothetical protein
MNLLRGSCSLTFKQFVAFLVIPFRSKTVRSIDKATLAISCGSPYLHPQNYRLAWGLAFALWANHDAGSGLQAGERFLSCLKKACRDVRTNFIVSSQPSVCCRKIDLWQSGSWKERIVSTPWQKLTSRSECSLKIYLSRAPSCPSLAPFLKSTAELRKLLYRHN